jgi:glutathionylspermidine synthase
MGQHMQYIGDRVRKTTTGFEQNVSRYRAENCEGCPLRGACHKSKGNRVLEVNHKLNDLKAAARENLNNEYWDKLRRKRKTDVEPVFGNIKQNMQFIRFMLRGIKKVAVEMGLLSLAHNFKKISTMNFIPTLKLA